MIVVDSSVWVAHMRNLDDEAVRKFRAIDDEDRIIVGDLILLEILQGTRDEKHAARTERSLRQFKVVSMLDDRTRGQSRQELPNAAGARHHRTQDRRHDHRNVLHRARP